MSKKTQDNTCCQICCDHWRKCRDLSTAVFGQLAPYIWWSGPK